MKKLLGLLFLIVSLSATAQYSPNPGNYGSQFNRLKPIIAAHLPERDSTQPVDTDSTSTIWFDTVHHQLLVARYGNRYGFSGGSVIDTTSLSNRINNCVLIANMPTYLASYLLSSSFDSMATALGYLKAFVQNSQLAHSSIFFQNSFGVNWNSSGVGTLGNNSGFSIDSSLFSTVNRLLDSIISVKTLISAGHSDTTIRGKAIPSLTAGVLKYSTSCNCWVFDSTSLELVANKTATASTSTTNYPNWLGVENYVNSIPVGTDTTINAGSGLSQSLTGKVKTLSINPTYNLNNQTNQGTIYQVLHGNSSGNTSYGFVNLTTDVSNNLPIGNLNSGTGASSTTFWRGDGTWATPSGGGGSGTVDSVSVTTANGVSGTVANPTTKPAISLTLGNITPTTVSTNSVNYLPQTSTLTVAHGNTIYDSSGIVIKDSLNKEFRLSRVLQSANTLITDSIPNESGTYLLKKDSLVFATQTQFGLVPIVNDITQLPTMQIWIAGKGVAASGTPISNYSYSSVDSTDVPYTTTSSITDYGGWLVPSTSGDSIRVITPVITYVENSFCGHPWRLSGYEQGNLSILDSVGQIGYAIQQATGIPVHDMGYGGQTSFDYLKRIQNCGIGLNVTDGYGNSFHTYPILGILGGPINDIAYQYTLPQIEYYYRAIAAIYQQYGVPLIVENCCGDGSDPFTAAQYAEIRGFNDWLAGGGLNAFGAVIFDLNSEWNGGCYKCKTPSGSIRDITGSALVYSKLHLYQAGYTQVGNDMVKYCNIPKLTKIAIATPLATTNPILNFARPDSITISSNARNATTIGYHVGTNAFDTIAINQVLGDSIYIKIAHSTTVAGVGDTSGIGQVYYYIDNNPLNEAVYTQSTPASKGNTTDMILQSIHTYNMSYGTSFPLRCSFDYQTSESTVGAPKNSYGLWSQITTAGYNLCLNCFQDTVVSAGNVVKVDNGGIFINGFGLTASGTASTISNIEIKNGVSATNTGFGLCKGVYNSIMMTQYTPTINKTQVSIGPYASNASYGQTLWNATANTILFGYDDNAGFYTAQANNSMAYGTVINPVINDTAARFTGKQIKLLYINPYLQNTTSGLKLFAIYARTGQNNFNANKSDSSDFGYDSTHVNKALVDFNGDINITDGSQGVGKVYTSDANGTGTWQVRPTTPIIVASNYISTQTSAQTISTYTTGAADSSYSVSAGIDITALSANIVNTTVTYIDETNTSRTITLFPMGSTSATLTTGPSNYSPLSEIRVKASTTITLAVTATGAGSQTYNAWGSIIKLHN